MRVNKKLDKYYKIVQSVRYIIYKEATITFNQDEYGSKLYVDLGVDISAGTSLTIDLERWRGDKKEFTTNIAVGTSNTVVDDQTFLANQFLEYTLQEDDLDKAGQWRARGSAIVSGELIKGDYVKFTVLD